MESKYSPRIQKEINEILSRIKIFKKFFSINIEYYIDGWAIHLKEKSIYPRYFVIFKSLENNLYSIKSFEIQSNNFKNEHYKELYFENNICKIDLLLKELKEIIYGKDIADFTYKSYFHKKFK
jgi:hypothetical protein